MCTFLKYMHWLDKYSDMINTTYVTNIVVDSIVPNVITIFK